MDLKYSDEKNIKTIEDYGFALVLGLLSLRTLSNTQSRVLELGILSEDEMLKASTIIWELHRNMKLYQEQFDDVIKKIPQGIDVNVMLDKLRKRELTKARNLVKKRP
jgi:hypothetical protein